MVWGKFDALDPDGDWVVQPLGHIVLHAVHPLRLLNPRPRGVTFFHIMDQSFVIPLFFRNNR